MVADGVASQPTYGTPSPQIAADGSSALGTGRTKLPTLDENATGIPSFCEIIDEIFFSRADTGACARNAPLAP